MFGLKLCCFTLRSFDEHIRLDETKDEGYVIIADSHVADWDFIHKSEACEGLITS